MSPEKLKKVEEIYHAALEVEPAQRESFLIEKCGADEGLRGEVISLLSFEKTSDRVIDAPIESLIAGIFAEPEAQTSLIGVEIGHYKIIRLLGKGGMGEVYLAEDLKLERQVALKILPSELARFKTRMNRFVREAKSASALNHPNIITIYEIGENDDTHFISAEYIQGETLHQKLKNSQFDLKTTLEIAIQIASALDTAHQAGIIHRDIKPENIMIRPDGLVKILDFGIAKLLGRGDAGRQRHGEQNKRLNSNPKSTEAGIIIGTANYMSPEQAKGKTVDARSDIFSFGIVFYEMLTGRPAFDGENSLKIINSILKDEPQPMSRILPEIPLEIERMVEKMLHKDLNLRYQSAQELLADLKNFKQDLEFQDKLEHTPVPNRKKLTTQSLVAPLTLRNDSPTSSAEYLVREVKKNKFGFALGAMILLAFIGLGYWLFATRSANAPIDSIAVLPFENKSATADSEYLADGLTESLIYRLSQLPNLKVTPKAAVFRYQGKEIDFRKIGDELGVTAVMTGRIIQRGNSLAISVELTDLRSNTLLWGEKYERKMTELLITQREISAEIAGKLQLKLSESGEKILTKRYTESNEAYQLYLRGRFHWSKRNSKDFERAIGYFKQAIEKDPNYALAYTGLADTLALIPLYGDFRPRDYLPNAKQSALKALELDQNLAEAHASLGRILNSYDFDWEGAEREFKEAVKLNPNYATAHQWYAELLAFRGRPDEALQEIKTALELDPFSLTVNRMKGNVLTFAKRYDEAIVQLNKTVELYPESALVRFNLGDAFVAQKMYAEAVEQYLIALELDGQPPDNIKNFKEGYQTNGWQGFWDEYLQNLLEQRKKLSETDETAYFKNESLAFAYAATKNKDKALEYLNKSFEERDPELITIKMSEVYDFMNDDPHFKELIKKIGLPE